MKTAVYPGTFDPVTNGHIDVIDRALKMFDKIVVAVTDNPDKRPLFTIEERKEMLREVLKGKKVEIDSFSGLLVNYLREKKVNVTIRGLRAVSDFDSEFQMAVMHRKLYKDVETVYLMTDKEYFYLSSSKAKEVARLGGDLNGLVPKVIEKRLKEKYGQG